MNPKTYVRHFVYDHTRVLNKDQGAVLEQLKSFKQLVEFWTYVPFQEDVVNFVP